MRINNEFRTIIFKRITTPSDLCDHQATGVAPKGFRIKTMCPFEKNEAYWDIMFIKEVDNQIVEYEGWVVRIESERVREKVGGALERVKMENRGIGL